MPRALLLLISLALALSSGVPASLAQAPPTALRVLSKEGTRALPLVSQGGQDYVALDDIATAFGVTITEDKVVGGVTVNARGRTILITPEQAVVSVSGRLVSLTAPATRQGARWLLPTDFLSRALALALETRMEVRRASRLLIVGDLRVPRVAVRVEPGGSHASVILDVTPATVARVTRLEPQAQGRGELLVTFDADALDLTINAAAGQDWVQSLQAGEAPQTVRLILGPKFGVHRSTTTQPDASSSRMVIDLLPPGTDPAPAPPPPAPPPSAPGTPAPSDPVVPIPAPATGVRTIVIDAGHGGDELGAQGARGTLEKEITLSVARRLRTLIEQRLGLRVYLTRDDDRTMSLDDRSAYANSQKADVFVSIHANASVRPTSKGAEVYYLSLDRADAEARRLAESSGVSLPALGGGTRTIDLILWETAQARYLEQSSALANFIEQAMRARVEMSPRPVQQAPFRVLVGANMPAVLVEIGYLSNPEQEQALASGSYQDLVAQALFDAIVQFRDLVERTTPGRATPPR